MLIWRYALFQNGSDWPTNRPAGGVNVVVGHPRAKVSNMLQLDRIHKCKVVLHRMVVALKGLLRTRRHTKA
jgi:hypothetical protein